MPRGGLRRVRGRRLGCAAHEAWGLGGLAWKRETSADAPASVHSAMMSPQLICGLGGAALRKTGAGRLVTRAASAD